MNPNLTREQKLELVALLEEKERRKKTRKLFSYYPDQGPLRRELYPKHMKFFEAGAKSRERLLLGGNRTGKTEGTGGMEMTYHLTGLYPHWWTGKRFNRPVDAWAAGTSGKTTRDIIQAKLFGTKDKLGTGLIPLDYIAEKPTAKSGVPDAFDTALIKHVSGGVSQLQLKSFDQGRAAFEGTEKDVIWLDEEPPLDVYTECVLRTMDTTGTGDHNGIIMITFTPLQGMSETVLSFLPNGEINEREEGSKLVVMVGWDDVPHLSEATKQELLATIPHFQRDARSKGIPQLGAGAIYPVPESDILVNDFPIPDHFFRAYGMDVGWNRTAAVWAAYDKENDIVYLCSEHYRGQAEPSIHAEAIKTRGEWIPGVIDPASRGRAQQDGFQLLQSYIDLGLNLEVAFNGVESGIYEVWQRLSTGRLKVFRSLSNWLAEYRLYRRDEKGQIVKVSDHLMDCLAPDTLVTTRLGKKKIIDLVGTTGEVLGIDGQYFKYSVCAQTRSNSEMLKLTFENGDIVKCTPDHKFMTDKGWVKAKDMLNVRAKIANEEGLKCQSKLLPKRVRNFLAKSIIVAEIIFKEMEFACTELFGRISMEKSQKGNISTMLITISRTIKLKTWLSLITDNISAFIRRIISVQSVRKLWSEQRSGTKALLAEAGTKSTTKNTCLNFIVWVIFVVSSVLNHFRQLSLGVINSALTIVKRKIVTCLAWIMKSESAKFVKLILRSTNTKRKNVAREYVACLLLSRDEPSDTYCLKVPLAKSFAVESGIIVHNCTRYLIMSGLERAKQKPSEKPNQSQEYGRSHSDGWMG